MAFFLTDLALLYYTRKQSLYENLGDRHYDRMILLRLKKKQSIPIGGDLLETLFKSQQVAFLFLYFRGLRKTEIIISAFPMKDMLFVDFLKYF